MANGFGTMYARIADELDRSDLTSQIKLAIISAIDYFSTERFFFNERRFRFDTRSGQTEYALPSVSDDGKFMRLLEVDSINITAQGFRYPLTPKPWGELDSYRYTTTLQTQPTFYSIHHESILLWPIPNDVYLVDGYCLADINEVTIASASAATNAWFTYGEEMVRQRAKADIYENVIRNSERAGAMLGQAAAKMQQLKAATDRQHMVGGITPWN